LEKELLEESYQLLFDAMNEETVFDENYFKKLAYYKCELIALHPFYELNGRVTRIFFDMILLLLDKTTPCKLSKSCSS